MNFNRLNNFKIIVFIILCSTISVPIFSQNETDTVTSDFWKHVRVGGGIGLSFNNGFFSGTLAPSAIYDFNDQFSMGIGVNATFNKLKNRYKSTILGGSLIGLYNPIRELQISGEFEELNVHRTYEAVLNLKDDRYWYPALFLGVGYRSNNFTIGMRYDVLYDRDKSIYADPWAPFVRVYF